MSEDKEESEGEGLIANDEPSFSYWTWPSSLSYHPISSFSSYPISWISYSPALNFLASAQRPEEQPLTHYWEESGLMGEQRRPVEHLGQDQCRVSQERRASLEHEAGSSKPRTMGGATQTVRDAELC